MLLTSYSHSYRYGYSHYKYPQFIMITWRGSELAGRVLQARLLIYQAYLGSITPSKIRTADTLRQCPMTQILITKLKLKGKP